eukprot:Hpha_TRINITY_DN16313_c0_g6::TRINITY_DN16313_c0_g6_i2::g.61541::m.61541/K02915/RP-L34e, RPL34; large subunit ribosomal protein L34e
MGQRLFHKRHNKYPTRANRFTIKKIPGGKLHIQHLKKKVKGPHTPSYLGHERVAGTRALRSTDAKNTPKRRKTVTRAYGGVLTAGQVRERIIRAFLIEEQKIVKRVLRKHK